MSRFRGKQTNLLSARPVGLPVAAAHQLVADEGVCRGTSARSSSTSGGGTQGCVPAEDVRPLLDDLKAGCWRSRTRSRASRWSSGSTSVRSSTRGRTRTFARPDGGPGRLAIPDDRAARLHHQQAHLPGVWPDRGSSDGGGLHRLGTPLPRRASPEGADLMDIAPRSSTCWGCRSRRHGRPGSDRDPRPALAPSPAAPEPVQVTSAVPVEQPVPVAYTDEEDADIQQRLADLGYL